MTDEDGGVLVPQPVSLMPPLNVFIALVTLKALGGPAGGPVALQVALHHHSSSHYCG